MFVITNKNWMKLFTEMILKQLEVETKQHTMVIVVCFYLPATTEAGRVL